jgi:hypothetical protein
MSSTAARRTKRRIERDKKKGIYVEPANPWGEPELDLPTPQEVEEYVMNKSKELRMNNITPIKINNNVQLQGK